MHLRREHVQVPVTVKIGQLQRMQSLPAAIGSNDVCCRPRSLCVAAGISKPCNAVGFFFAADGHVQFAVAVDVTNFHFTPRSFDLKAVLRPEILSRIARIFIPSVSDGDVNITIAIQIAQRARSSGRTDFVIGPCAIGRTRILEAGDIVDIGAVLEIYYVETPVTIKVQAVVDLIVFAPPKSIDFVRIEITDSFRLDSPDFPGLPCRIAIR